MRYEYRITMDVNAYSKPHADAFNQECVDEMCEMLKGKLVREIELMFGSFPHVFCDVRVTAVPHDNDRDYTEDDARRQCGRTYLDAVREAFPGADVDELERSVCPGMLFPDHPSHNCGSLCPYAAAKSCYECWRDAIPDSEEVQDHDD